MVSRRGGHETGSPEKNLGFNAIIRVDSMHASSNKDKGKERALVVSPGICSRPPVVTVPV